MKGQILFGDKLVCIPLHLNKTSDYKEALQSLSFKKFSCFFFFWGGGGGGGSSFLFFVLLLHLTKL